MKGLAFSTNAFNKTTLHEAIDAIASIGYGGVELMADVPHAYPPTFTRQQREHKENDRMPVDRVHGQRASSLPATAGFGAVSSAA